MNKNKNMEDKLEIGIFAEFNKYLLLANMLVDTM